MGYNGGRQLRATRTRQWHRVFTVDAETLYRQLGRLIETCPKFAPYGNLTSDQLEWLGRARALLKETGDLTLVAGFDMATQAVHGALRLDALPQIMQNLYHALAIAELNAPPSAQGAFIPANSTFDAFTAINKVLQSAKQDILMVDPYLDEAILTEYGGSVPPGVMLRLLSDQSSAKDSLKPAATRWAQQHGAARPLGLRLAPPKALHDRLILIDGTTAHTLTQSLKDFAKRSPAEIVRTDDTAALKVSAYEAVWATAAIIV